MHIKMVHCKTSRGEMLSTHSFNVSKIARLKRSTKRSIVNHLTRKSARTIYKISYKKLDFPLTSMLKRSLATWLKEFMSRLKESSTCSNHVRKMPKWEAKKSKTSSKLSTRTQSRWQEHSQALTRIRMVPSISSDSTKQFSVKEQCLRGRDFPSRKTQITFSV